MASAHSGTNQEPGNTRTQTKITKQVFSKSTKAKKTPLSEKELDKLDSGGQHNKTTTRDRIHPASMSIRGLFRDNLCLICAQFALNLQKLRQQTDTNYTESEQSLHKRSFTLGLFWKKLGRFTKRSPMRARSRHYAASPLARLHTIIGDRNCDKPPSGQRPTPSFSLSRLLSHLGRGEPAQDG